MAERDFKIGNREFQLHKVNVMKQYHLVRRLTPILTDLIPGLKAAATKKIESLSRDEQFEEMAKFITPVMNGLSKLSDKDSELVLFGLLEAVSMKQDGGNWARITTNDGTQLMFQDLELPILMMLAGRAFAFNLSGFFDVLQHLS